MRIATLNEISNSSSGSPYFSSVSPSRSNFYLGHDKDNQIYGTYDTTVDSSFSKINTQGVSSMSSWFYDAQTFNEDISGWNVESVESMYTLCLRMRIHLIASWPGSRSI